MIDDARMMHGVAKARLLADGLDFHSALNGDAGLALALAVQPDIILLDVEMPSPDGFEVWQRLKADPALLTKSPNPSTGLNSRPESG